MNKIDFTNLPDESTPINATNMNKLQKNVDEGKIDKNGDTINGVLSFNNKTEDIAIQKATTVDNIDYIGSFAVSSDSDDKGVVVIENNSNNTTLGRLEIRQDGNIYNGLTNKKILDEAIMQRINSDMFDFPTDVQLLQNQSFRIGNMIFLNIKVNANITTNYDTYFTLDNSLRPSIETVLLASTSRMVASNGWIRSNGQIAIKFAESGNSEDVRISAFYPLI